MGDKKLFQMRLLLFILLFTVMLVGCSENEPLPGATPTSATSPDVIASPDMTPASPRSDIQEIDKKEEHSEHDGHDH